MSTLKNQCIAVTVADPLEYWLLCDALMSDVFYHRYLVRCNKEGAQQWVNIDLTPKAVGIVSYQGTLLVMFADGRVDKMNPQVGLRYTLHDLPCSWPTIICSLSDNGMVIVDSTHMSLLDKDQKVRWKWPVGTKIRNGHFSEVTCVGPERIYSFDGGFLVVEYNCVRYFDVNTEKVHTLDFAGGRLIGCTSNGIPILRARNRLILVKPSGEVFVRLKGIGVYNTYVVVDDGIILQEYSAGYERRYDMPVFHPALTPETPETPKFGSLVDLCLALCSKKGIQKDDHLTVDLNERLQAKLNGNSQKGNGWLAK